MALIGNFYNGLDSVSASDYIPLVPQRSIRRVTNLAGLPAGNYIVWFDCSNPTDLLSICQFALNTASLAFYVRVPTAFPNIWGPWAAITPGPLGGVTSFNGRIGAVVPVAGDYNSTQITNLSLVPGANVTLALNALLAMSGVSSILAGSNIIVSSPTGNVTISASLPLQALGNLVTTASTGYLFQTGSNTVVDGGIIGAGSIVAVTNNATGVTTISSTANVLSNGVVAGDVLEWNGAAWVPNASFGTGNINDLHTNTFSELTPGTPITGAIGLNLSGNGSSWPMWQFTTNIPAPTPFTGEFQINNANIPFNQNTVSMLCLHAELSTTLTSGTNFIMCINNAAPSLPYLNDVVFQVQSDGTTNAFAFTVWSSISSKKNIEPLKLSSTSLKSINPAKYHYKSEDDKSPKRVGVMLHEMKNIVSEVTSGDNTLDMAGMHGMILALMKDLEERVSALEARN
jgi:hypothetical protein